MDTALAVEQLSMVVDRDDGAAPDIGMDIEPALAVAPEGGELVGRYIVSRERERHHKALAMQRVEELTAVGMIVRPPDESALARHGHTVGSRLFGPSAPGEQVRVADRVVARVKRLALPPEFEQALGDSALVARIVVDRSPSLRRPPHDLYREGGRRLDQTAVAIQRCIVGSNQRGLVDSANAGGGD